jgi:hypothetical protein
MDTRIFAGWSNSVFQRGKGVPMEPTGAYGIMKSSFDEIGRNLRLVLLQGFYGSSAFL